MIVTDASVATGSVSLLQGRLLAHPLTASPSELQKLIDSTYDHNSPFHLSHAPKSTDITVYPAPAPSSEPEPKKRKLDSGDAVNGIPHIDLKHAKHPGQMVSNKHIVALHEQLKRECETLAELCVSIQVLV